MPADITAFIDELRAPPPLTDVFNPWRDVDRNHDRGSDCPAIRAAQLQHYLAVRQGHARWLLCGEALGYQGGHFSGIAMTSERILLGHLCDRGVAPAHVLPQLRPRRTSREELNPKGFSEPTATIVWQAIVEAGLPACQVVIWNAFPWHPYKPDRGLLSNRTPRSDELALAAIYLPKFLKLFPALRPVAVGKKCAEVLTAIGLEHDLVRHPANGGAGAFRRQFSALAAADV